MAPATPMRAGIMQTHEELELREYANVEFAPYVQAFMRRQATRCKRCKGLMLRDCEAYAACRCVQCGDLVDPTILKNRATSGLLSGHDHKGFKRPEHVSILRAISSGRY